MEKSKRKTNVLFILIQVSTGGAERVVLDLARNLDRSKFNVYVAFFFNGVLQKDFHETCTEVFNIPKKNGFDFGAMLEIAKIIRSRHIDVINAHHYMPFFYSYLGIKLFGRRRLIYTEHSIPEVEGVRSSVHRWICNAMFYNTDGVVGVSKEIAESLKSAFPIHSRKIITILNGVDVERFSIGINRDQVRAQWGFLPEHFVIGTVANFRKVKNHSCLIRAFNRLTTVHRNIRLAMVGRGFNDDIENSEEELRDLIHSFNLESRVVFTGYREDVPELLQCFDVFCLPSFSEGLPVSILEAMAAGVPVVGSNVWGIREVIFPEETGLLFPSDDDNALSQALGHLVEDHHLCKSLSQNAFSYVCQYHGIRQWISTYQSVLQDINSIGMSERK